MKIIKGAAAAALGLSIAAAAFLGGASAAQADPTGNTIDANQGNAGAPSTQLYALNLTSSNKLLTDHGQSMTAGARMDLFRELDATPHVPQLNQLWEFVPDNGADDMFQGTWGKLKNAQSGLCLNLQGGVSAVDTPVIQWQCGAYANEEFKAVPTAPGSHQFTIVSQMDPAMGIGVNDDDGVVADEFPAISRPTALLPADTRWTITRMGGTPIGINDFRTSNEALDSNNAAQEWGVRAITNNRDLARYDEQVWYLQQTGTRTVTSARTFVNNPTMVAPATSPVYRLVSVVGNDWAHATCLGTHGDNPAVGAVVETYGCDPNGIDQPNQQWIFDNHLATYGSADTDTAVADQVVGVDSNAFVMFNAAMLDSNATTQSYPALSISSTSRAFDGSKLTMEPQNGTTFPAYTQIWSWFNPAPVQVDPGNAGTASGNGGNSTTPSCVGQECTTASLSGDFWETLGRDWEDLLGIS